MKETSFCSACFLEKVCFQIKLSIILFITCLLAGINQQNNFWSIFRAWGTALLLNSHTSNQRLAGSQSLHRHKSGNYCSSVVVIQNENRPFNPSCLRQPSCPPEPSAIVLHLARISQCRKACQKTYFTTQCIWLTTFWKLCTVNGRSLEIIAEQRALGVQVHVLPWFDTPTCNTSHFESNSI